MVKKLFFALLRRLIMLFVRKPELIGVHHIDPGKPGVFVANHLGSYGPMALALYMPFKTAIWVTHEMTDHKICPGYLEREFIRPDLKLRPPLSRPVSFCLGRLCVSVMTYIEAIPVFKHNRKIMITMENSVKKLREGRGILVFPEIHSADTTKEIDIFNPGFIGLARSLYRMHGQIAYFHPVCVTRAKQVVIGRPVAFDPSKPFPYEKKRIADYLHETILDVFEHGPAAEDTDRRAVQEDEKKVAP